MNSRENQSGRTLELLASREPGWVPAPELAKISLQYCRVINTLRKQGHVIENRVEIHNGGRHGFYRLASRRNQASSPISAAAEPVSVIPAQARLLPTDALRREQYD